MAGNVHRRDLLVQNLGPGLRELVDRVVDAQLVPGHRLRRDDHGVAALDAQRRMVVVRDARQRRQGLALASGAQDQLLVWRELLEVDRSGKIRLSRKEALKETKQEASQ